MAGTSNAPSGSSLARITSTQARIRAEAGEVVDYFCDECGVACKWTDRGSLCPEHYVTICEHCGLRPAVATHNGYWSCGKCISEGRYE